jgi:tRNA A37 threonylcarbamoyltransferase TsaD
MSWKGLFTRAVQTAKGAAQTASSAAEGTMKAAQSVTQQTKSTIVFMKWSTVLVCGGVAMFGASKLIDSISRVRRDRD